MIVTVDTGGTKTLLASFDSKGKMSTPVRFPTPHDPSEYVALLTAQIREHYGAKKVEALVIALPGTIVDGVATWCRNLGWINFRAHDALKDILPGVPLLIENDANLGGLAETRALHPMPVSSVYITVSTGIGSGIVTNGVIDPGLRRSEAGQIRIEYKGKVQEWESFASGRAITKVYRRFARDIVSARHWRQIADRISRGLLVLIPIVQPDVIIIGGSLGTHFKKYHADLQSTLERHLPPHIPCPPLRQAAHPEEAVIYGCYYHGRDYLARQKATK